MLSRILHDRIPAHDYEADTVYAENFSDAVFSGCLTNDELNSLLGIPMDFDKEIEAAAKKLRFKKRDLFTHREVPSTRESLTKEIAGLKEQIEFIGRERTKFFTNSAEYIGVISKNIFLEAKYKQEVFETVPEDEIRKIARSYDWSSLYNTDFKPIVFNYDIINLINWTKTYNNIAQHPDKPDDYVIENDDMLDGWMMYINNKKDVAEPEGSEVFIVAKNPHEIKEIQNRNSIGARVMLQQRAERLKGGEVREQDLPDKNGLIKF